MDNYLPKLHETELRILKEVVDVCEKLNLKYILMAGSLLGAVRHKGFIPWDDDIDIGMPREDYEVFLKEAQKMLPSNLFVQHYTTEENTNCLWIKVRNINTVFLENDNRDHPINHGIFIDVFPMDRCMKYEWQNKLEAKKYNFFVMLVGCCSDTYIQSIVNSKKRFVAKFIRKFIIRKRTIKEIIKKEDDRRKKLNDKGHDLYLLDQFVYRGTMCSKNLFETQRYIFEGEEFDGPIKYDEYLNKMYGDYMTIPPVEKQVTHKPLKVVFENEDENE